MTLWGSQNGPKMAKNTTCDDFTLSRGPQDASGSVLGASWAVLGASWAVLGRILAPLSSEMGGSGGQEAGRAGRARWAGGAPVRSRRPPGNLFGRKFEGLEDWKNLERSLARPAPVVNHGGGGSKTPPATHRRPRPSGKTPPMRLCH